MASPTLETFCCAYNVTDRHHIKLSYQTKVYNIICISSAVISILGVIYQWWPRKETDRSKSHREVLFTLRQKNVLFWLSLTDILACTGIFTRSLLWLCGYLPHRIENDLDHVDFAHYFCAISSAWVQYFYICTYFWTFNYALDAYYSVQSLNSKSWVYQVLGWIVPLLLCIGGLFPLYYPSLLNCEHDIYHLMPHYLSTYFPIILVMTVNPVLYFVAMGSVRTLITKKRAQYTNVERQLSEKVRDKFYKVMLVFYICWTPNILNGILLLVNRSYDVSKGVFMIVWMIMAVVNPLQAFLNTVVYRGWNGCDFKLPKVLSRSINVESDRYTPTSSTEVSPLICYKH